VRVQPVGSWFQIDIDAGRAGLSTYREVAGEMGVVVFDQDLLGGKPELGVAVGMEHSFLDVALDLQPVLVCQRPGPTVTFAHFQPSGVDPHFNVTSGRLAGVDPDLADPPRGLDDKIVACPGTESLTMGPDQEPRVLGTNLEGDGMKFHTVDATPCQQVSRPTRH
jgi:hypothetical protein